jgi:hypothetical protein
MQDLGYFICQYRCYSSLAYDCGLRLPLAFGGTVTNTLKIRDLSYLTDNETTVDFLNSTNLTSPHSSKEK